MKRKHISYKTKYAAELLWRGDVSYGDAKRMTEDQIISLYHTDHNILYETGHPDRDKFWNLKAILVKQHREKTKQDAKIIAKSRRIRGRWEGLASLKAEGKSYADLEAKGKFHRGPASPWPPKGSRKFAARRK